MRAVIQRVSSAEVTVEGVVVGSIRRGLLVLVGVSHDDSVSDAHYLAEKVAGLRIFEDTAGKMNLSLGDVDGSCLVVSQFTLYGDCRKGRRPSFVDAAAPEVAEYLYTEFVDALERQGLVTATGKFRQHMNVTLVNDGPVTLLLDSTKLF